MSDRQNRDGHPCPPWCATDHDEELMPGHFATVHSTEHLLTGIGKSFPARISGCLTPSDDARMIHVSGMESPLFVPARAAEGLACFAEMLAAATPEQHAEVAAAIRQAAALIAGEDAASPAPEDGGDD